MLDIDSFGTKRDTKDALSFDGYVLFGAGNSSDAVFRFLAEEGKKVIAYVDNDGRLHGKSRHGVKIHPPDKINALMDDRTAVIISCCFQTEIALQLTEKLNIGKERMFPYISRMYSRHYTPDLLLNNRGKIDRLLSSLSDDESRDYLLGLMRFRWTMDPSFLKPNDKVIGPYGYREEIIGPKVGDTIVDCGAYDGDTIRVFLSRLKGDCKVYAFEPFEPNFRRLKAWVLKEGLEDKVIPSMKAIGNSIGRKQLFFTRGDELDLGATTGGHGSGADSFEIEGDTLDNLFYNKEKINFIKMDIEGVEIDALTGTKKVIEKDRPSLAMSAYHRAEDLWEIPLMISGIHQDYKIFAGHHPNCIYEVEYYFA